MKPCSYCGRENEDAASICAECGTATSRNDAPAPSAPVQMMGRTTTPIEKLLNDPVRLFRTLVALSTGSYVLCFFEFHLFGGFVSPEMWSIVRASGADALLPLPARVGWLIFILYLAVAVGLWTFAASARTLFAALTAFWLLTALLSGTQVQTAVSAVFALVTALADGAILVMAYTLPLKQRFSV
jgi:hypothetical protein